MLAEAVSAILDLAATSHQGHARQQNEDFCFIAPEQGLAIVADGVGGQGDGAWASHRAVELFIHRMQSCRLDAGETAILDILQSVHREMFIETRARGGKPSGTTIAGLWAPQGSPGPVTIFNVGDSPVFHLSGEKMIKVSKDHSLYQLWVDGGSRGREPAKRTIVQALGISEQLTPHLASFRVVPGDAVLICTDGLSGGMTIERMADLLASAKGSQAACDALLHDVLAGPAKDNVTVSVGRF
jgi:serine/threonine protein phosphatase PrpC